MADFGLIILFGVLQGSIYTSVALGLVLVFGVTDIVNFAHGELVTFGAFGIILLAPVMGFLPALVVTLAGVALIAALLYLSVFRLTIGNHLQALVLSLAILIVVQNFMILEFTTFPRRGPSISGLIGLPGGVNVSASRLVVLAALLMLAAGMWLMLRRSWVGLALRVCGDDQFAAATLGLSARRVGLFAFVASGLLAAGAGVGIAALYPVTPLVGVSFLLRGFAVVIIGGLGSVGGALIAAIALGVLESLGGRYLSPAITEVYTFGAMIAVLLVAPQGLFNRAVRRA